MSDRALQRRVLAATSISYVVVILDTSIVNVALERIAQSLATDIAGLQWIVNAYTLTLAGFLLLGGRAADLLGDRRVFIAGLAAFTVASLVGALANQQLVLIDGNDNTLNSTTTADASVPNTAGASVAVSVITGDTTASVTGAWRSSSGPDGIA